MKFHKANSFKNQPGIFRFNLLNAGLAVFFIRRLQRIGSGVDFFALFCFRKKQNSGIPEKKRAHPVRKRDATFQDLKSIHKTKPVVVVVTGIRFVVVAISRARVIRFVVPAAATQNAVTFKRRSPVN